MSQIKIDYSVNISTDEREDGWYWFTMDLLHEMGPFKSKAAALKNAKATGFCHIEPESTWQEFEDIMANIGQA